MFTKTSILVLIIFLLLSKEAETCLNNSFNAALATFKKQYEFLDNCQHNLKKRSENTEKNQILKQKYYEKSHLLPLNNININKQQNSLISLINKISLEYLNNCPPVIYYDNYIKKNEIDLMEKLFQTFPLTYYQTELDENYKAVNENVTKLLDSNCKSFILFLTEPIKTRSIIGPQLESRVVVISKSTQWKLRDFLISSQSSNILNLLVIGESLATKENGERPYILYTHQLYADALGYSVPLLLTSWIKGNFTRPHINLFPLKFADGFAGHRFQVMAANQPPFIFRLKSLDFQGVLRLNWEGIEYRLLNMISKKLNFSFDIHDTPLRENVKSPIENMAVSIKDNTVDIAMSGIYITIDRLKEMDMSQGHSKDCAAFVTLASKALPKYRAIMGPFQWPVWVVLTLVYLCAIFPIVYSDRLTLSHLIGNWSEIENMFWYVFGMFTNSFSFSGKYSWTHSRKWSTRILIGSYWIFTIIITSCYTGSIIAFVTLPAFPDTVDSVDDLLGLFFRVVTLDHGGWELWFRNSTHDSTARLYKKMEYVANLQEGVGNVTDSFIWNYAFLGSKARLEYLIQANFSNDNLAKRSALHLSSECFANFQVGFLYPSNSVFKHKINTMILLAQQSGLMTKIENDVKWNMQRSATGRLLQASSSSSLREVIQEERQLTTADTEGMFLLMALGYLMGILALISEIVGGITNKCRQMVRQTRASLSMGADPTLNEDITNSKMRLSSENTVKDDIDEAQFLDLPEIYSRSYINLMVDQLLNSELFNDLLPKWEDFITNEEAYRQPNNDERPGLEESTFTSPLTTNNTFIKENHSPVNSK